MNHKWLNKSIGVATVILLVGIIFTSNYNTYAKGKSDACSSMSNDELITRYGFSYDRTANGYSLSINPATVNDTKLKALKSVEFKVISVNGTNVSDKNWIVSGNKSLTIPATHSNSEEIVLQSSENSKDPECKGQFTFTGTTEAYENVINSTNLEQTKEISMDNTNKALDCNGGSKFDQEICLAKANATNKKQDFTNSKPESFSFKCNPNTFLEDSELEGENYYTYHKEGQEIRKKYLYGYKTFEKSATYTYHLSPGEKPKTENVSCKIKCEEGVSVEYGPPVASKAGLCFEYKVRVTSRVKCSTETKPPVPNSNKYQVCTPGPVCTNSRGSYHVKQGGPNEEFDKCVKKCDGGKYSSKCSDKCYKKVYGSTSTMKTNSLSLDYSTSKLADDPFGLNSCMSVSANRGGCYVRSGNSIVWKDNGKKSAGRYYSAGGAWKGDTKHYKIIQDDGFYRHDYGSSYCHDTCTWSGCNGDYYLNYGFAEKDKANNDEVYKNLINECNMAASCSTETAEFAISVDYTDGNKKKQTINFPYDKSNSKNTDKLTTCNSKNGSSSASCDTEISSDSGDSNSGNNGCSVTKGNSTLLSYAGCYKNCTNKNYYMGEWSFPGSWINLKTGEITYKDISGSGWRDMDNKFCLPLDARNVNGKWWNTYYGKRLANITSETSANSSAYVSKCLSGQTLTESSSNLTYKESDIDYNIHASTQKFGYIGWDIGLECFYALNDTPGLTNDGKNSDDSNNLECTTGNKTSGQNARVRSIALDNMFPSTDGSSNGSSTKSSSSKSSSTKKSTSSTGGTNSGRVPGFNWTDFANITDGKNSEYTSSPASYANEVQSIGYRVYTDEYLDYEIPLTPETLKKIKSELKSQGSSDKDKNNYTAFNGKFSIGEKSGVSRYKSYLIREISGAKYPNSSVFDCNNINNYRSTSCK